MLLLSLEVNNSYVAFQLMLTISLVYLSGFYIHLNAVTIENFQTNIMLLTIRPVDRKGYGSIAHEAKPNGLLTRGP